MSQENAIIKEAARQGYICINSSVISSKGKLRKLNITKKGYYYFSIRYKGNPKKVMVHKLKAFQKFGKSMFAKGIVVRHKDDIKSNNDYDNILIGTQSDNMMDTPKEARILRAKKAGSAPKKKRKNKR